VAVITSDNDQVSSKNWSTGVSLRVQDDLHVWLKAQFSRSELNDIIVYLKNNVGTILKSPGHFGLNES